MLSIILPDNQCIFSIVWNVKSLSTDKQEKSKLVISDNDYQHVAKLLGREPRGLRDIAVRTRDGDPAVIRVASLVDNKPFPTLFWLIDKKLNYAIDQLEAGGLIAQLQSEIDASDALQQALTIDHEAHIALRSALMLDADRDAIAALGFTDVLSRRGIGGIENFTRIRCLHTYYASHLVSPNTVGKLVDQYWQEHGVVLGHL